MVEKKEDKRKKLFIPGKKSLAAATLVLAAGTVGVYACPDANIEGLCANWCWDQGFSSYDYECGQYGSFCSCY